MSHDFLNDVGPGWRPLVKPLLGLAARLGIEVTQVKEKFGTLRFYVVGFNAMGAELEKQIDAAEHLSGITCEECGAYGYTAGPGWLKTYCEQHHVEAANRRAARAARSSG